MKGSFKSRGSFLAMDVSASELKDALGDDDKFKRLYEQVKNLPKAEVLRLSKEFSGASSSSKSDALFRIWHRHDSLMTLAARARATGGRTAA